MCDKVVESTRKRQAELVRHQLEMIQGHQEALCSLVTVTDSLRWEKQVKGQEKIVALWEKKDSLENLTVTFKTTSEMVSDQGNVLVILTAVMECKGESDITCLCS